MVRWDFEKGGLQSWKRIAYGNNQAFTCQPMRLPTKHFWGCSGCGKSGGTCSCHGRYAIISNECSKGTRSNSWTGILESPTMTLRKNSYITLLVGGGRHAFYGDLYKPSKDIAAVTLEVFQSTSKKWTVVNSATGEDSDQMRQVVWGSLGESYDGLKARIRIYDTAKGQWGHIAVDDVKFRPSGGALWLQGGLIHKRWPFGSCDKWKQCPQNTMDGDRGTSYTRTGGQSFTVDMGQCFSVSGFSSFQAKGSHAARDVVLQV